MVKFKYWEADFSVSEVEFEETMVETIQTIYDSFEGKTMRVEDSPRPNKEYPLIQGPIYVSKDKKSLIFALDFGKTRAGREYNSDTYRISITKV